MLSGFVGAIVGALAGRSRAQTVDSGMCAKSKTAASEDQKSLLDAARAGDRCVVYTYNGFGQLTSVRW
jgi:hypothetical protein